MNKYYGSYNRITLRSFTIFIGAFNNRKNADAITLRIFFPNLLIYDRQLAAHIYIVQFN